MSSWLSLAMKGPGVKFESQLWQLPTHMALTLVKFLKLQGTQESIGKMQVLPSLCKGLHSTEGLAHHEHAVNGGIVTIAIKPTQGPFGFCGLGVPKLVHMAPNEVTGRAGGATEGCLPWERARVQAPHGQSLLKALY